MPCSRAQRIARSTAASSGALLFVNGWSILNLLSLPFVLIVLGAALWLAGRSGWSFSADFGLVALAGGNVVRLGRVFGGNQGLDDLVRGRCAAPP